MTFKIFDWAGNPILPNEEFKTFEGALDRISLLCAELYGEDYPDEELGEYQVLKCPKDNKNVFAGLEWLGI